MGDGPHHTFPWGLRGVGDALGPTTEPNVGDNGVHASASPFEALVERMNWVGAQLEADDFGQALLAAGVPRETILAWTKDPQVWAAGHQPRHHSPAHPFTSPAMVAGPNPPRAVPLI